MDFVFRIFPLSKQESINRKPKQTKQNGNRFSLLCGTTFQLLLMYLQETNEAKYAKTLLTNNVMVSFPQPNTIAQICLLTFTAMQFCKSLFLSKGNAIMKLQNKTKDREGGRCKGTERKSTCFEAALVPCKHYLFLQCTHCVRFCCEHHIFRLCRAQLSLACPARPL